MATKRLEDIGFYTLSDKRAQTASHTTRLMRCELILTDACNFHCLYCRGLRSDLQGTLPLDVAKSIVQHWLNDGLKNVRFSGGEPTLYKGLVELVSMCKNGGVERIAISTNGSAKWELYEQLLEAGVNDFSVSLDGGCCAVIDKMAGKTGQFPVVTENIRKLSQRAYVTVGMVFTNDNIDQCVEAVLFADSLGVSDIRVIPAAQYNEALVKLADLPESVLTKYPILRYRIENVKAGRHVRGINEGDSNRCWLVLDDMAIAGEYHFPCIIYLREGGDPIGKVGPNMREERRQWAENHDCAADPICSTMCLDVCVDYCNKANVARYVQIVTEVQK